MANIFQTIGNAFKTGWNNGNIKKGLQIGGALSFTAGITRMMINSSRNQSIFGNHCCHGGFNGFPPYSGMNMYSMQDPMAMLNASFMQQPLGGRFYNQNNFGMFNMNSDYMSMINSPQFTMPWLQTQQNKQTLKASDNDYAGDVSDKQDTKAAEKLNKDLKAFADGEKEFAKIVDLSGVDEADYETQYKEQVSELGKSFIANIDKGGNKDGKVNVKEYVDAQLKDLPDDASSEEKEEAKQMAISAFAILDQNADGKLDWKEAAAMMRTFDRNEEDKVDGKIQAEDFQKHSDALASGASDEGASLRLKLKSDYNTLFGDD